MLEYATGPAFPDGNYTKIDSKDIQPAYRATCGMQKIRGLNSGGSYLSFSVLGLALVIAIGGSIIILSLALEPLVTQFRRWKISEKGSVRTKAWEDDDMLQLYRSRGRGGGDMELHTQGHSSAAAQHINGAPVQSNVSA